MTCQSNDCPDNSLGNSGRRSPRHWFPNEPPSLPGPKRSGGRSVRVEHGSVSAKDTGSFISLRPVGP
jgi:hypothetical protein